MSDEIEENTDDGLDDLGLTEAELEAVRGKEEEEVEETKEDEPEADDSAEDAGDVESAEEDAESEQPEVEAGKSDTPRTDADVDSAFTPQFTADSTDGLKEKLDQATEGYEKYVDDLAAKYENGDITFSEYRKQEREAQRVYDEYKEKTSASILKAEIAEEHSRQASQQRWETEQQIFYSDNPSYKDDPVLRGALGAQLEALYANEENKGRSGLWFLREAGRLIDERFNRTPGTEKPAELAKAQETMKKRAAKPVNAPKTLGDLPAAEANEDGGEFAYMDRLQGLDYEKALMKMSPDQYERFMAA